MFQSSRCLRLAQPFLIIACLIVVAYSLDLFDLMWMRQECVRLAADALLVGLTLTLLGSESLVSKGLIGVSGTTLLHLGFWPALYRPDYSPSSSVWEPVMAVTAFLLALEALRLESTQASETTRNPFLWAQLALLAMAAIAACLSGLKLSKFFLPFLLILTYLPLVLIVWGAARLYVLKAAPLPEEPLF